LSLQFQLQASELMAERIILARAKGGGRTGSIKAMVR